MPDNTANDVYDDPDNMLADTDDTVDGAVNLPAEQTADISQSIYTPEKNAPGDDRGAIPELELTDGGKAHDEVREQFPEDSDTDSNQPSNVMPADENDGTEK